MNVIGEEVQMQTEKSVVTLLYAWQWTWFSHKVPEMRLLYEDSFSRITFWVNNLFNALTTS
jgi:hypothetical protein